MADADLMEKLVSLCKRRGFIFQSSEIYGGLNGCWDYGPLGVELKRNIKHQWWQACVTERDDMVGLDASILMNARVWEASGHVASFTDPMVDCRECKLRFRADQVWVQVGEFRGKLAIVSVLASDRDAAVNGAEDTLSGKRKKGRNEIRIEDEVRLEELIQQLTGSPSGGFIGMRCDPVLLESFPDRSLVPCPECHVPGTLTDPRPFNLMFKTFVGAVEESSSVTYLRPETAQGIFANFKNVLDTARVKIPFGIAQIGKAFRNEITPRYFTFRTREFEQMEIEFFVKPGTDEDWYRTWQGARLGWYRDLGLGDDHLRMREHEPEELAHYARACCDVEYQFPFGWGELEGIANRTDYDLTQHANAAGRDLSYFDDETRERYVPYVIEPSAGVDRSTLAFLCEAYHEEEVRGEKRVVMRLHPRLAPIKAAVLPLVNKDGMPERALDIYHTLKKHYNVFYDAKGAVGRRYRRQDEAGTPLAITVDGQTAEDGTVTFRDRDTMEQWRVHTDGCLDELRRRLDAT